ncbi:unnamed protein product [Lactuca saligna]|uniref:Uncharacterized protein n=1 Tax=Lactuca saligna TaxID=75948 RepID=A0AA35YPX2_LACSI|nr:unnamed protein product [Lactuca saligna]
MLKDIKESVVKPATSSIITIEFHSHKFTQCEAIIHKQLAPLSSISNLLPTDAPPVQTGVQRGERGVGEGSHVKAGGDTSHGEAKIVCKVFPSKIPSNKPTISSAGLVTSTIVTYMSITTLVTKGIVIGSTDQDEALKTKEATNKSIYKGKTIVVQKYKEYVTSPFSWPEKTDFVYTL